MKKLRWQILIVVIALIAIGILLIGYQPTILPGVEPVIEPTSGGLYTEALIGSLGRLNPLLDFNNQVDQDVNRLIYSSLIKYDDQGIPWGDLADSWGISQDGTVYNFSIRKNSFWHDGEPITSSDIKFTIDLIQSEGMPIPEDLQSFWKLVELVIIDESTIQFRLPEPFAPFLDYLTIGILPEHIWQDLSPQEIIESELNLNPVGSGPYRFDRLLVEGGVITGIGLKVYEDYYRDVPYIEEVIFRYYPDLTSSLAAYRQGEVLGLSQVREQILAPSLREGDLNIFSARGPRLVTVLLNLGDPSQPYFQDSEVRRALLIGINRQAMINRILMGQAIIAHGPILPSTWAYYDGIEQLEFDTDHAISMLKNAGYTIPAEGGNVRAKEGIALAFELLHINEEPYISVAESIQNDWEKLGVKAVLRSVTREELLSNYLETHTFDAALVDLNLSHYPDPDPYPFWHQTQITGGQNYSQWDDRQASEYLEQARVEVDLAFRMRRYYNFQVRFTNEMPALPLYHPIYSFGIDVQIQGVTMGPIFSTSDRFNNISSWFLLARQAIENQETPTIEP